MQRSPDRLTRPDLIDGFGRVATDLRISVTDRCNFRCRYCMPAEGLPWLPKDQLLSYEEIERLARILVESGVRSIKVTGGEPLVRRDVPVLVRKLRALGDDLDLSITTNGFLLAGIANDLKEAGLDRVTVSCDSLVKHRFAEMTLRDALEEVMAGLRVSAAIGLTPVKINCVVIRGHNEDEAVGFAELARSTGYEVRFIEYMPLDAQDEWSAAGVVPGAEILAQIAAEFPLLPDTDDEPEPATPYVFADGAPGRVGVIPSVTEPFCDTCNRLRLTADGHLMACLFSLEETNLRDPMRAGAGDDELAELARSCIAKKWSGHRIGRDDFVKPVRSMSMIGG
ncbi:MAG: 3,8-cyclase [Actinomycetota bacterium]|jgi:cyclic pyranopterin phosphate synthase|nr:3,8-cyclase [Actinomycetota bacterium]